MRGGAQHGNQVLLFVVVVQVRRFVEVAQDGAGSVARLFVGAVFGQVRQQFFQGGELLADAAVAMLEHGDRLGEIGGGVGQE